MQDDGVIKGLARGVFDGFDSAEPAAVKLNDSTQAARFSRTGHEVFFK